MFNWDISFLTIFTKSEILEFFLVGSVFNCTKTCSLFQIKITGISWSMIKLADTALSWTLVIRTDIFVCCALSDLGYLNWVEPYSWKSPSRSHVLCKCRQELMWNSENNHRTFYCSVWTALGVFRIRELRSSLRNKGTDKEWKKILIDWFAIIFR